jgi:hypothetical protein
MIPIRVQKAQIVTQSLTGVAVLACGVRFREAPRHEPYGTVAVFEDPWGNPWDLIQRRASASAGH